MTTEKNDHAKLENMFLVATWSYLSHRYAFDCAADVTKPWQELNPILKKWAAEEKKILDVLQLSEY